MTVFWAIAFISISCCFCGMTIYYICKVDEWGKNG